MCCPIESVTFALRYISHILTDVKHRKYGAEALPISQTSAMYSDR